jgi:hypothetical protein
MPLGNDDAAFMPLIMKWVGEEQPVELKGVLRSFWRDKRKTKWFILELIGFVTGNITGNIAGKLANSVDAPYKYYYLNQDIMRIFFLTDFLEACINGNLLPICIPLLPGGGDGTCCRKEPKRLSEKGLT